jgi:hypothetical protein
MKSHMNPFAAAISFGIAVAVMTATVAPVLFQE